MTASNITIIVLAAFSAILTFLRLTAPKTANTVDDKLLAIGEKLEVLVAAIAPKVEAAPAPEAPPAA